MIRSLVGPVRDDDLRYVDSFVFGNVGLFMPVGGACFYALAPEHTHPSYMFTLNFDDTTTIRIGTRLISAEHGRLMALSPHIPHQELPTDRPPRYIAILIGKAYFEEALGAYTSIEALSFQGEMHEVDPSLLPVLRRFMVEADSPSAGSAGMLSALSVEICHLVIRTVLRSVPSADRVSERIEINRAIEHMHSALEHKLSTETLASVARMSPSNFTRTFRAETGRSPIEYLTALRMDRARKLLIAGERTITEIALECGFGTPSYLSSRFRDHFGLPPSHYLKGSRNDRISKDKARKTKA